MKTSISEEDILFCESLFHPRCFAEALFTNYDNLAYLEEGKLSHIRNGQIPLLSFEYLIANDSRLSEKKNFSLKIGAGNLYCLGGRNFGKSVALKIDMLNSLVLNDAYPMAISSYDAVHIRTIIEPVIASLENHPIISSFKKRVTRSPTFRLESTNNSVLESINMNIAAKDPGNQFFGKHLKKLFIEEWSFETDEVNKKRIDSRHELGCIDKFSGMCNFTKFTPAGKVFSDLTKKPWVLNLPQYINPTWDDMEKLKAIKKHSGEECFDEETEILTVNGWKTYQTINKDDKVLSLNIDTGYADYQPIKEIFISNHDDFLYYYKNSYINFAITENHKILKKSLKKNKWELIPLKYFIDNIPLKKEKVIGNQKNCLKCGKLLDKSKLQKKFCSRKCQMSFYNWRYYPLEKMKLKRDFYWKGKEKEFIEIVDLQSRNGKKFKIPMDIWLSFLGWFISEGHVTTRSKYKHYKTYYISISQTKNKKYIDEIEKIVEKMGFIVSFGKGKITFGSIAIYKHLIQHCYKGNYIKKKTIYNSRNKRVPEYIKFLSSRQIKIFLDAFFKGDGNGGLNEVQYHRCYSSSVGLLDDLQELAFKINYTANIRKSKNKNKVGILDLRTKNKNIWLRRKNLKKEFYKGKVWCVETTPNNTLFVRREGNCHWSGNSIGFRMFVKGEVVEEGVSVIDMSRIRPFYNDGRILKKFEITKDNLDEFTYTLIVERPKNSGVLYICADIGETAPTEIAVLSKVEGQDIYNYLYDITLRGLTDKEQTKIFTYLGKSLNANFIGLDVTDGTGRAIFRSLEEVFPKENLVWCSFNAKIAVDFEKNEFDQVIFKDGKPLFVEEYISEWSIKHLISLLYEHKIDIPEDCYKLDEQLNKIISLQSGSRIIYKCTAEENHALQAMQVFAIAEWMNRFNLIKPINQKKFFKGFM